MGRLDSQSALLEFPNSCWAIVQLFDSLFGGNLSLRILKAIGNIEIPIPCNTQAVTRERKLVAIAPSRRPKI